MGAGSGVRGIKEQETCGMKNRKAERGGDPGSEWGPCMRTTLQKRKSSERQNDRGPRNTSDSPPGPLDSNPSPSTERDVLFKPLPVWATEGGGNGPPGEITSNKQPCLARPEL